MGRASRKDWLLVAAWAVGVAAAFWLLGAAWLRPPATPPPFPTTMGPRSPRG